MIWPKVYAARRIRPGWSRGAGAGEHREHVYTVICVASSRALGPDGGRALNGRRRRRFRRPCCLRRVEHRGRAACQQQQDGGCAQHDPQTPAPHSQTPPYAPWQRLMIIQYIVSLASCFGNTPRNHARMLPGAAKKPPAGALPGAAVTLSFLFARFAAQHMPARGLVGFPLLQPFHAVAQALEHGAGLISKLLLGFF